MRLEEGKKEEGDETRALSDNLEGGLEMGRAGFIYLLIHKVVENQRSF